MREISYIELFNEVIERLSDTKEIVVATCYKEKVTARTVYCICDGVNVYFLTSKAYTKYKQIQKNPMVALSIGNIQIEGEAEILGHPLLEDNFNFKVICERDREYFEYYKKYSKYKNTVLIKVKSNLITIYGGRGAYKYLNIQKEKAYKKGSI